MKQKKSYRKQDVYLVLIHSPRVIHWLRALDDRHTFSWFGNTSQTCRHRHTQTITNKHNRSMLSTCV